MSSPREFTVGTSAELALDTLEQTKDSNKAIVKFASKEIDWKLPPKKSDKQLSNDLIRGNIKGNRLTVNGELFTQAPEYDPDNVEESLKKFLLRALFKNDQTLLEKNFARLYSFWTQAVFSIFADILDSDGNRSLADQLMFRDLDVLTDLRLDKDGNVYAESYVFNIAPFDYPPEGKNYKNQIAWHVPGVIKTHIYFDNDAARIRTFAPSNEIVKSFVLKNSTPLINRNKLLNLKNHRKDLEQELAKVKKANRDPRQKQKLQLLKEEIKVLEKKFKNEVKTSDDRFKKTKIEELRLLSESIKQAVAQKKIATDILNILSGLEGKIPEKDLGSYFTFISLLRLSIEQPTNISFLLSFKDDYRQDFLKLSWAKELIPLMDDYLVQAGEYFYQNFLVSIRRTLTNTHDSHAQTSNELLQQIDAYKKNHPENLFELIGLLSAINNSLGQDKLIGTFALPGNLSEDDALVKNLLKFKAHYALNSYNKVLETLNTIITPVKENEPAFIEKARLARNIIEKHIKKPSEDISLTEADIADMAIFTSALSEIIEMLADHTAARRFKEDAYQKFDYLPPALTEFSRAVIDYALEQKFESLKLSDSKRVESLRVKSFRLRSESIRGKVPPSKERSILLQLDEASSQVEAIDKNLIMTAEQAEKAFNSLTQLQTIEDSKLIDEASPQIAQSHYETLRLKILSENPPSAKKIIDIADELLALYANSESFEIIGIIKQIYDHLLSYLKEVQRDPNEAAKHLDAMNKFFINQIKKRQTEETSNVKNAPELKREFFELAKPLANAKSIPIEKRLELLAIATKFVKAAKNASDQEFVVGVDEIINSLPETADRDDVFNILYVLYNLRDQKASDYFNSLYPNKSTDLIDHSVSLALKALNVAFKTDELDMTQYTTIVYMIARFLESKRNEGVQDFAKAVTELFQTLDDKPKTNDVLYALDGLAFAKATAFYDSTRPSVDANKTREERNYQAASDKFAEVITTAESVSQFERTDIIFDAAHFNEAKWDDIAEQGEVLDATVKSNIEKIKKAQQDFASFNTAMADFTKAVVEDIQKGRTKKEEFQKVHDSLNDLRIAKAMLTLEKAALSFKGSNPFVMGAAMELLSKVQNIKDQSELTQGEANDLCQFLMNVTFALRSPYAYFQLQPQPVIQLNGNLKSLAKFKEKLIDDYAFNEAEYKSAERELIVALKVANYKNGLLIEANNKKLIANPTTDQETASNKLINSANSFIKEANDLTQTSVNEFLKEIKRVKRTPTKENRVPMLAANLKQMAKLVNKPQNTQVQAETFQLANELSKVSWGRRIAAGLAIVIGTPLLLLGGIGYPLIQAGLKELEKQDELSKVGLLATNAAKKAAEAAVKVEEVEEKVSASNITTKYSQYFKR